jgi:hypothetical protein
MKAMALVPAVVAAILTFNISAASSQQACMKEFQACMDGCTSKPSKAIQDGCFLSCEGKNNVCAERVYGKRPVNGPASAAAEQKEPDKDALATVDKQAAEARDQADSKPAAPEPQQPKRSPAKR